MKRSVFLNTLIVSPLLVGFGKKNRPKLAYSTLGCPDWSLDQIIETAVKNGYSAIEIRGVKRQLDLPLAPEFSTHLSETIQKLKTANLHVIDLGSSANLHHADAKKHSEQLVHAKRFIDLAVQLNCPFVRVFPNDLPKNQDRQQTINQIITALQELGAYAKPKKVTVLLESHGQVIYKDLLAEIMQKVNHPNIGLIWDIWNMWSVTKEPVAEVYETLKPYIKHTHIKDGIFENGTPKYVLLGQGIAPLKEALAVLKKAKYNGYYSFEWEKMWHPEIEEPEIAIPHYNQAFLKIFNDA